MDTKIIAKIIITKRKDEIVTTDHRNAGLNWSELRKYHPSTPTGTHDVITAQMLLEVHQVRQDVLSVLGIDHGVRNKF